MLDEKDLKTLKEKSCNEISKIARRMEQQSDVPKADLENLVLALKAYEKLLNIESMDNSGYSGYSRGYYSRDDYSGRRGYPRNSYDNYSGDFDERAVEDMIRNASPRDRERLMQMLRR